MIALDNTPEEEKLRILLIDDHSLFRAGLCELLKRKNIDVIASVNNGKQGIEKVRELQPDIVLLDIRMPEPNGLEILRLLKSQQQQLSIVMVTTSRDDSDIAKALELGANGYLLKDMEPDDLIKSLQSIKRGELVIAPELSNALARVVQGKQDKTQTENILSRLTPRENEILHYLAEGGSNKAIARILNISDGTVKLHVKSILRKLDVHSRVEAAVIAVECGLSKKDEDLQPTD